MPPCDSARKVYAVHRRWRYSRGVGIVYLAALILGLGTLTLQFVLSHVGGGDTDGETDELHLDAGGDEVATQGDIEHVDGAHGDEGHESMVGGTVGVFLSMRFWTFALMAFGMVGSLLHWLELASFGTGLTLAFVSGVASGFAAAMTFRLLKGSVSSATSQDETVGKMARVTVPLRKGSLGKVRVQIKGKTIDLLAATDSEIVEQGEDVVVVDFRGEHAIVEPLGKNSDVKSGE